MEQSTPAVRTRAFPTSVLSLLGGTLIVLAFSVGALAAQQTGTILGRIVEEGTQRPIAGAQVAVLGEDVGTITGANGAFQISGVPAGTHTLQVRLIGYTPIDRQVSVRVGQRTQVELELDESAIELEGIVVTALGIDRAERSLGYAQQQVGAEELVRTGEADVLKALSGQVAGLNVTNIGPAGGSVRVMLRGATSIQGENQPLIIVDGVPVDNSGIEHRDTDPDQDPLTSSIDYGNALGDIPTSEIESVNVLKGANAAALYGSRAANGAIVITTKKGAAGASPLEFAAKFSASVQTPLRMPDYQNEFGQGGGGVFGYLDGYGGGVNDGTDESWGPRLDGRTTAQWWTNGELAPWVPRPYNVRDFYETGTTFDRHLAVSIAGDRAHARLSLNDSDEESMIPNHRVGLTTVALSGGVDVSDRLRATGRGNYTTRTGGGLAATGYEDFNPNQGFFWFGRQVDTNRSRDYLDGDGRQRNWNYNYHDNPYWERYELESTQARDRLYGFVSLQYEPLDWVSLQLRSGTDWYTERREQNIPKSQVGRDEGFGGFTHTEIFREELNHDFVATIDRDLSETFSLNLIGGANLRSTTQRYSVIDVDRLNVDGVYNVSNAAVQPSLSEHLARKDVRSLYGAASFGYNGYFFVDVTGRNDWSSTLPQSDYSYFYPSVSTSLILSEALPQLPIADLFPYMKLRASWARVGSDAEPYQLAAVLEELAPVFRGEPGYSVSQTIPNADLRPEQTDSWEVGLELRTADERALLDLTYYNSRTTDQILPVQVTAASGFESQIVNAGEIASKGVEAVLGVTPIRLDNGLSWDLLFNFSKNSNKVVDLYGDLQTIVLGTFWGTSVQARKGETYGALYGFRNKRDSEGRVIIGEDGFPVREEAPSVLGHYPPDWTGGIRSTLRYGDIQFSVLVDGRFGGEIFSVTNMWGKSSGVLAETVQGREQGYDQRTMVFEGVHEDGTPNTTPLPAQDYWKDLWGTQENNIFDASFVKLREVTFAFDLPQSLLGSLPFGNARLTLTGRNLALLYKNVLHIDPETGFDSGNVQGVEYGQIPSPRSILISLSLTP